MLIKHILALCFSIIALDAVKYESQTRYKKEKRALQKEHEKPQADKWMSAFFGKNLNFDQVPSLVSLVNMITINSMAECSPVILYDSEVEKSDGLLLEQLFRSYSIAYMHGQISALNSAAAKQMLNSLDNRCVSYILFMADVMRCRDVIGEQNINKVVVVARSSQWRVYEFLESDVSKSFVNLLVIAQTETVAVSGQESPYILYTHKLYVDGLGSSSPQVLTSWIRENLTRPEVPLFPSKMSRGFAGHRFIISVANQPPYVIKRDKNENDDIQWDGIEIRTMKLLAELFNFTLEFREARGSGFIGSGNAATQEVIDGKANIGLAGIYTTEERIGKIDISHGHSQDCASFISLTSTALPRYRAIMGPFHWTVWLALTLTYLLAIFPLSFSDRHTLKHLLKTPEEIENMFWYVFGTFTNSLTFSGKSSWSNTDKVATRLFIGMYWIFTIIITACYTGSIIAFVTLPIYPATVDTVKQLLSGRYQIGTLDRGGWEYWFENSSDPRTTTLLKNVELLPSIEAGLKNTTKAFFWPYAFLGSRAELDYIVRTNFTTTNKRSLLHITSECFVPYEVGFVFAKNSVYKSILSNALLRLIQSGFVSKFTSDVEWNIIRSATGQLLQANGAGTAKVLRAEDRALTLDDTQGMFLLLGIGFLLGGSALLSEWLGGCFNFCKRRRSSSSTSISSNPRSHDNPTPRQKLDSIQYNNFICHRLGSILDDKDESAEESSELSVNTGMIENCSVDCLCNAESTHKNKDLEIDMDKELDKIFNFDDFFGEEHSVGSAEKNKKYIEEIDE